MSSPLRPRAVPQCSTCLRSYALAVFGEPATGNSALRQQVRGKKKMVNAGSTVPVRLLKDVKTFGRKGSIVPIAMGQMRNDWFPRRIAEYVTLPEMRTLRINNVAVERNFDFGATHLAQASSATAGGAIGKYQRDIPASARGSSPEMIEASMFQKKAVDASKLTPQRSAELVDIFVPPKLEFYRQPIIEEQKEAEPMPEPPRRQFRGMGAAADLMAARTPQPGQAVKPAAGPQPIYGSLSTHDVLMAIRAVMEHNDEAKRVVLHEDDVKFVDLPAVEGAEAGRVKHVGEFVVEIAIKGADRATRRTVRVVAQEA